MKLDIAAGKYVLAVSGGVDSMVLLDLLSKKPGIELIAAHFNHGIREDSGQDEELVRKAAAAYGVVFESGCVRLGKKASEESARNARYEFLKRTQAKHTAKAIITAHHQDDLIETAFINLIRGTGRKGLSSMAQDANIRRPLLSTGKTDILSYARKHNVRWSEDSTNDDADYLRNYLRLKVLCGLSNEQRLTLISKLDKVAKTNIKLDAELATLSQIINVDKQIDRQTFTALPSDVGNELMAYELRRANILDFDRKIINRLSLSLKTSKPGTYQPIKGGYFLKLDLRTASLITP